MMTIDSESIGVFSRRKPSPRSPARQANQHDEHEGGRPSAAAHAGLHSHLEIVVLGLWQFTALWAAVWDDARAKRSIAH